MYNGILYFWMPKFKGEKSDYERPFTQLSNTGKCGNYRKKILNLNANKKIIQLVAFS